MRYRWLAYALFVGVLAFAAAGAGWVAVVVGVLAALHLVATFPLGQRRPWVDAKPA